MSLVLREATEEDARNIVHWRNSDKVLSHCFNKEKISVESHLKFFKEFVITGKYKQYMVERVEHQQGVLVYPIAVVSLKDFDSYNKRCELCVFTSNDEEWNTENQRMAIELILDKAFCQFFMHKVYSYVFCENTEEIELMKSVGFEQEAIFKKESLNFEGQYVSVARFAIYTENWAKKK